ncbi:MAG TPA: VWA domain-containing protein, partial [Burkholderiaceae bacterium]|nr:VWA domain-containing protein [Burkholderiaceae bacterium]
MTPTAGAPHAVALAEIKPMLTLFAQAIVGGAVALRDDGDPGVPTGPGGAALATFTLPRRIDWFARERDNRGAYRVAVLRQAAAGLHDPSMHALLRDASVSWRRTFRWLERLRVDAALARRYPGARADLSRLRAHELACRQALPPPRRPLTQALAALARHALGGVDRDAPAPMLGLADTLRQGDAGPVDSARVATQICRLLQVPSVRRSLRWIAPTGPQPAPWGTPATQAAGSNGTGDGDEPAAVSTHDGVSEAAGAAIARWVAGPRAAGLPRTEVAAATPLHPDDRGSARSRPFADDEPPGRGFAIDEWDYRQQRLRPDWCTLVERRQHGSETQFIHQTRRRHAALARRVRGEFAAWRPEGLQRVHGASDGDEIEIERAVDARVDRRAGVLDDAACYLRRDRAQRDVATVILVDTSASTDFVLPDGRVGPPRPAPSSQADTVYLYDLALAPVPPEPPKRRVIDVAKDALALICDALHALGDCFAVYAFSGHGRGHVDFRVVKSFDEAVSSRTAGAIAALRPRGATRTGAAIRHASAQLARQPQRQRALIVLTDGYPEDIDYGPEPRDLRYGLEDTAHALKEAQALGLQTFC